MEVAVTKDRVMVGERADGSQLALPLVRHEGEPGPSVFIGVSIHGDEITGQASLWKLMDFLKGKQMRGTVTAVPVMNPEGFNFNVRGIPESTVDLNRVYPGDPNGSIAERLTAKIWEIARKHDYIIDVHTAGWCIPFVLVDPATGKLREKIDELASATGITVLDEYTSEKYQLENLGASLPGVAIRENKVSFTVELGGFKGIDWNSVEAGYLALRNILSHLKVVDAPVESITTSPTIHKRGYRRRDVHSLKGGIIEYREVPGSRIRKGDVLARVRNIFGEVVEEVQAPEDGFVIALNPTSVTQTGGYIAEIAVGTAAPS
jgi:hypothetical protein